MARPLRIEIAGGRYHVTARGNERREIFRQDRDRVHFLELLAQLPARFGAHLHAYVLMENHYHLLVETPEANLSRLEQWLNVSYTNWFNRRHRRVGHLFQGRFKAVLIEDQAGLQKVARYVHLNPVRIIELGLDKGRRRALAAGLAPAVSEEVLRARVECLRAYRWSSYLVLAGYQAPPDWLSLQPLRSLCGGRKESEQIKALRRYTEEALHERAIESPWKDLLGGMVLGTEEFARAVLKDLKPDRREQAAARRLQRPPAWREIVHAMERAKGEKWADFSARHGDWGRDGALWLGRHAGRMRLAELAREVGCDYTTVGKAVSRFGQRLKGDPVLAKTISKLREKCEA